MDGTVGTPERELAMAALDEHRRSGRLERAEHGRRCATASRAEERAELDALFADLPEPHPVYPQGPAPAGPVRSRDEAAAPAELPELVAPSGAAIARHAGLISLMTPAVAAVLFAASGFRFPWIFVMVPVVLAGVAWMAQRHAP